MYDKLSAHIIAQNGLHVIHLRKEMWCAIDAISALHDGLLAVCTGKVSPEEAKEFFCFHDESKFIGGVLTFTESEATNDIQ